MSVSFLSERKYKLIFTLQYQEVIFLYSFFLFWQKKNYQIKNKWLIIKHRLTCNVNFSLDSKKISHYNMMKQFLSKFFLKNLHIRAAFLVLIFTYMYLACARWISPCYYGKVKITTVCLAEVNSHHLSVSQFLRWRTCIHSNSLK